MKIEGMIKAVGAAIAAGGADVTQILKIEIFDDKGDGKWKDLRDLMQKPLAITLEPTQMSFGDSPARKGSVETSATVKATKKIKKTKDLITV